MITFEPHKTLAFYIFFKNFMEGQSIAKEVYFISASIKTPRALSVNISLYPKTKVRDMQVSPPSRHCQKV